MTRADEIEQRWAQYSASVAKANGLNKGIVFDALSAAGITHVAVGFDGGGASGQIDGAAAHTKDGVVEFPETKVTIYRAQSGSEELATQETTLRDAVEELCYGYLEQKYAGWEINDGAFGEFAFHVAERRIDLDFNGRFTDHVHHSHAF
jgi:hypothetical protein